MHFRMTDNRGRIGYMRNKFMAGFFFDNITGFCKIFILFHCEFIMLCFFTGSKMRKYRLYFKRWSYLKVFAQYVYVFSWKTQAVHSRFQFNMNRIMLQAFLFQERIKSM